MYPRGSVDLQLVVVLVEGEVTGLPCKESVVHSVDVVEDRASMLPFTRNETVTKRWRQMAFRWGIVLAYTFAARLHTLSHSSLLF